MGVENFNVFSNTQITTMILAEFQLFKMYTPGCENAWTSSLKLDWCKVFRTWINQDKPLETTIRELKKQNEVGPLIGGLLVQAI